MKLSKRGNGIYQVAFTVEGKRKRVSTGESERRAAEVVARAIIETHNAASEWTLSDALYDCHDRIWSKQKSGYHALRRLEKLQREFRPYMELSLVSVSYDALVELGLTMERRGSSDATINRFYALISKALVEAVKRGKLELKPPLPYRKESTGKLRWLTDSEELLLIQNTAHLWAEPDASHMASLIRVLVDTGCRLSEILGVSRLPVAQLTLYDTKNSQPRSVPLTDRARDNLPNIPMWTAQQAIGRFSRLRESCGLHDVSLHTLRHTCASRLVQGGMDLYRVKEWLGHSSITVTQRYAHLSESNLTQGVDILAHRS